MKGGTQLTGSTANQLNQEELARLQAGGTSPTRHPRHGRPSEHSSASQGGLRAPLAYRVPTLSRRGSWAAKSATIRLHPETLCQWGSLAEGARLEPAVPRWREVAFRAQLPGWVPAQRYRSKPLVRGNPYRGGGSGFWVRTKQSDMAFEVPSRWFSAGKLKIC